MVAAISDPNPKVKGRGLAFLRRAGVAVVTGVLAAEARRLNERFAVAALHGRPFILLKAALTLDGRIATARRESRWITGADQRRAARRLRRLYDGVVVGIGTVLADDPILLPSPGVGRPFVRVVLDTGLRIPLASRLVRTASRSPLWVVCGRASRARRRRLEAHGVTIVEVPTHAGRVDLRRAVARLWKRGLWSLMVEGGSEVLGSFLAARLLDQVVLYRAPLLLGGRGSLPAFGGPDPARLSQALRLSPAGDWPPGLECYYPVR